MRRKPRTALLETALAAAGCILMVYAAFSLVQRAVVASELLAQSAPEIAAPDFRHWSPTRRRILTAAPLSEAPAT